MKKRAYIPFQIIAFLCIMCSCEEDIIIDTESGAPLIGIYGGITTDTVQHSITISRTTDFYSQEYIEMISGADIFILDMTSGDTMRLRENTPGIYKTDLVAGVMGHSYLLDVTLLDQGEKLHFYSESQIDTCPGKIDSIQIHKYTMFDEVSDDVYKLCPFFQTTKKDIYYQFDLSINDRFITDTLSRKARLHMGNWSGIYYNGEEMSIIYKDLNTYPSGLFYLDQTLLEEKFELGDTVHIALYGIPKGYYNYLGDISNNIGSNPLMGSPTNVRTNIKGKEKEAVGYFYAASCIHFEQIISKLPDE